MATPTQSSVQYYPGYAQQTVIENLVWKVIDSISNSFPMTVNTILDHNYVDGMMVRFNIPSMFGMQELNIVEAQVLTASSNVLTIDLDSTNFSVFSYPISLPSAYTPPTIIPDSSGKYLPPKPLPEGNQTSFEGTEYNNGAINNPINGR